MQWLKIVTTACVCVVSLPKKKKKKLFFLVRLPLLPGYHLVQIFRPLGDMIPMCLRCFAGNTITTNYAMGTQKNHLTEMICFG